ncbi:MAG: MBOAT family protein [Ruminococcaceae bacterium]|nr:MBOAT family protein [Oscillospiraceae bacterium]
MVFSSITFLYYFLPIVLILYFVSPTIAIKNGVLLVSSLFFYGWGEPMYLFLMVATILVDYLCGLVIGRSESALCRRITLIFSVVFSLGVLAYFKYADFFIDNFNTVTGLSIPLLKIALPVGISFYTFQTMSYVIDVYRRDVEVQRNPLTLGMYITMFPQLIAGPIVRYSDIVGELNKRKHSFENISYGITRFVMGLSKKVLIADTMASLCDKFRASDEKSVLFYWMYAVAFSLQIYFDFSGYSDMAIGMGRAFGFNFPENFNYPYISKSITEFWRRWHMTLGTWFRDYLYIPLGGNRVKLLRWIFNILVVWMATGFWHGAAWNFILWGLMFALLLLIEKPFLTKQKQRGEKGSIGGRIFSHVYVLFLVMISFVLFNAVDLKGAGVDILSLFGYGGIPAVSTASLYYLGSYAFVFIIAIIGATPIPKIVYNKLCGNGVVKGIFSVAEPVVLLALLLAVTAHLVDGSFSPFLYFRF